MNCSCRLPAHARKPDLAKVYLTHWLGPFYHEIRQLTILALGPPQASDELVDCLVRWLSDRIIVVAQGRTMVGGADGWRDGEE